MQYLLPDAVFLLMISVGRPSRRSMSASLLSQLREAGSVDNPLKRMTRQELLARRQQDEIRMGELDPQGSMGSKGPGPGVAQRHSRYLDEYQTLKAEVATIDALLKKM
ncbi:MAG: hypothetical protein WAK33_21210 [Silvibacterium sp.]